MPAGAETTHDVVVLGGGSGGYACALRAAGLGLRVALVEKAKLGGTCLHQGCIPTKALLHAAEVADTAREGSRFGVKTTFESVDMSGVNRYKDGVVARLHKGLRGLVSAATIDYVEGEGRLVAPDTVAVGERRLTGRHVVLATGSSAEAAELRAHLGTRIATWQLPERWAFIAEVPKTSVGKFDKKVLRRQYAAGELDVVTLEAAQR